MPRYSVIIPVYKVEDYLPACVDSVLAQDTSSEYEVILVDDGSPDSCGAICDGYAARNGNVRVIHQKNAGVSVARNAGMAAARGEYLLFLDGDDLWKPQLLSTLDTLLSQQPDMVLFCFETFDEDGSVSEVHPPLYPNGESGRSYLERVFAAGSSPFWSVCAYAFRNAFVRENHVQFIVGLQVAEDMDFTLSCLSAAKSVYAAPQALYRYRTRYSSVSHRFSPVRLRQRMELDAKWFDVYPVTPFANYYALEGLSIASASDPAEQAALKAQYFQRQDILTRAAGKSKLAYRLLRVLGIRLGAKAFFLLVRCKQRLTGKRGKLTEQEDF